MDGAILGLLLAVLSAQGLVWYKLGRVEQRLNDHLQYHKRKE